MAMGWMKTVSAAAVSAVVAACGGGGGGPAPVVEAVVTGMSSPTVLEGDAGSTELRFVVTLDKPAVGTVRVVYSTASTATAGGGGTGSATGGAACSAGVDYITATSRELAIAPGTSSGTISIPVCPDTTFEPTETLRVTWSFGGNSGSALGTILNDDAGGLNGSGVATGFGRDTQALTNDGADGPLGFSFANVANAAAAGGNCVRDKVTGLLWEPKQGAGLHNPASTFDVAGLAAHVAAVNAANTCGFNDWALPTTGELSTLVDNGTATAPVVSTSWLTNQASAPYWTGTTYANGAGTDAWIVDFATGTLSVQPATTMNRVRLVSRGGTVAPAPAPASCTDASRFTVHADNTVTDTRTGLMWKQCAEGQGGASCGTGAATALTWAAATSRPDDVNNGAVTANADYRDWRLPTRAELSSIAEREVCQATGPSVIASVFPNTTAADFWTQTPYAFNATLAWRVGFLDGEVAPSPKTSTKLVRLVRAGQ